MTQNNRKQAHKEQREIKLEEFIRNNKYVSNKKYHKGITYSESLFGSSNCIFCGNKASHQIKHNRKTDNNGYIHNGYICYSCGRYISKHIDNKS